MAECGRFGLYAEKAGFDLPGVMTSEEFSDALEGILVNRGIQIHKESVLEKVEKADEGLRCHYVCRGKKGRF